jgi:hypothetical protein
MTDTTNFIPTEILEAATKEELDDLMFQKIQAKQAKRKMIKVDFYFQCHWILRIVDCKLCKNER